MPNTNAGPAVSAFVNEVPLRGTFDTNGKLLQILGSGQNVAFDPANVAITGGVITGGKIAGAVGLGAVNAMAAAGDSVMAGAVAGGSLYSQSLKRAALPFRDAGNFAVAGTRTDQIASQIPAAALAGASILAINGGINDIVQGVSEPVLQSNLVANWNASRAAGMEPISIGLPPTNTSGNVPRYVANEIWRKLYCRKNNIRHVDFWTPLATGAGGYVAGNNADAIHPNSVGAIAASNQLSNIISSQAGRFPTLLAMTDTGSDAGTYLNNAVSFAGGATPTGWFPAGTGGVLSVTAPDTNDLGSWLRCTVTAGTNAGFNPTAVTLASLGWSIGDRIATGFRIRWSDTAQALSVTCLTNGIATSGSQPMFQETGGITGNSQTIYSEQIITSGTVINIAFFANGTGFFEVNRPIVVNLTKLGFPNGVL